MNKSKKISSKELKKEAVKTLSEKVALAKTVVFINYHGLTVNQISKLRSKIKEAGGELLVAKNTLFKRALLASQLDAADKLKGATATIFAYEDEIAPLKIVAESNKSLGLPTYKLGFFGKTLLDVSDIEELSKIPTRDILHSKVVGAISSPLFYLVSVLQANIRNLVITLDQISLASPSEAGRAKTKDQN